MPTTWKLSCQCFRRKRKPSSTRPSTKSDSGPRKSENRLEIERLSQRKGPMTESTSPIPLTSSRVEQIFPVLTPAQMRRLTSHGAPRSVRAGEVLVELGDGEIPMFVVISGELEIVRSSFTQETRSEE